MPEVRSNDAVFKALADHTRRSLLDRLFERDGASLGELESELSMSRFGVMKHLRILEDAHLVTTRRSGRKKLHYLNPLPIRSIHDRWIDKYTERRASMLVDLKAQLESKMTTDPSTTQIYEIYIKASAADIWTAITDPEWTARYGYQGPTEYELRPGGAFRAHATPAMRQMGMADVIVDGEVLEVDPPRKLVQTYRFLFNEQTKAEGFSRVTWQISETASGFCLLSVTHELDGLPGMAAMVSGKFSEQGSGGWGWILSDLKSLLETGQPMSA